MRKKLKQLIVFSLMFALTPFVYGEKQVKTIQDSHADPVAQRLRWWTDARYGMFIHWGIASLSGQEISWSRGGYGAEKYDSLALRFNPKNFDATQWVATAKAAGMKYMVLTAKHHDGFCLWNTKTTTHNIMNTPFGRDVCKELAEAAHKADMKICWYFSLRDWKDPDCSNPQTNRLFVERLKQQLTELLTNYGEISLLWYDYDGWAAPICPDEVNGLVRSLQPDIIVNNRSEVLCPDESHAYLGKYGDYATPEQFVGSYGEIPWETCANLAQSGQWAWRWNDKPVGIKASVERIMRCSGGNGNLLLNVGPDSLGVIPPDFVQRLKEVGAWLDSRKEALYGTLGGPYKPNASYSATRNGNKLYLCVYQVDSGLLKLPPLSARVQSAVILGGEHGGFEVDFKQSSRGLVFEIPENLQDDVTTVIAVTTNRDLIDMPVIAPQSKTGSLAYNQRATASSSIDNVYMHNPAAAVDDDPNTTWVIGRRDDANVSPLFGTQFHFQGSGQAEISKIYNDKGWLEVDLGKSKKVSKFLLLTRRRPDSNTFLKRVNIQYLKGSEWITIASKEATGTSDWDKAWEKEFPVVKARKFRVEIVEGCGYMGISEFELF